MPVISQPSSKSSRAIGGDIDRTGNGVLTKQGRLRAFQNLDTGNIEKLATGAAATAELHTIDKSTD
jgi:hypothetical protein